MVINFTLKPSVTMDLKVNRDIMFSNRHNSFVKYAKNDKTLNGTYFQYSANNFLLFRLTNICN